MRTSRLPRVLCAPALFALCALGPSVLFAADPPAAGEKKPAAGGEKKEAAAAPASEAEVVVKNLKNPCGIAIQPNTGHVFVSSRFGVYRYIPATTPTAKHEAPIEIAGYPDAIDVYGKGPMYDIGPLGLAFLDNE